MIPIALFAVAALSSHPTGWTIDETVVLQMQGSAHAGTQRTEIAEGRLRRTQSADERVLVVDANDGSMRSWDDAARTTFSFGRDAIAEADLPCPLMSDGLTVAADGAPTVPAQPFRATGRRARVGMWDAVEWVTTQPGPSGEHVELWLARDPETMPDHATLSILDRVFDRAGSRWRGWFDASAALPGFPVKTVRRYPDGTTVTTTVTSIEPGAIESARFFAPAEYRRVPDPLGLTPVEVTP